MKLCIITMEDAKNPKTWSGTPKKLIENFQNYGVKVENFKYENKIHYICLGKIKRLFSICFYMMWNLRDHFLLWFTKNAKFFKKNLNMYNVDAYLFMGEHCLKSPVNGKTYAYIDRILRPLVELDEDARWGKKYYLKQYEKNDILSMKQLEHIFTQNEWSRNEIINRYGFDSNFVTNIGFGINVHEYYGEKNYENHKLLIVLREGTEHYKGLDLLLEAFSIAIKKIPDISLHVVGTEYKECQGVIYYYKKSREVTMRLFQECALYTMPALLEPNGITYLEALACKTPILGLNRFAFPEFSGYGRYGFIVQNPDAKEVAEQIINAFSDIDRLKKMGIEGQKFVLERYRWDSVAKEMLGVMYKSTENMINS